MAEITNKVRDIPGLSAKDIRFEELVAAGEPIILRGAVKDWPLVQEGLKSAEAAMAYMQAFDAGRPVTCFIGEPEIEGRFFYNDDLTGFNFRSDVRPFPEFLAAATEKVKDPKAPSVYAGSTDLDRFFPGFRAENDLLLNHPMFEHGNLLVSAWIGNHSITAAHYDMSQNIACCAVGKRRFTLFPPEAIHSLYPGPLDPTPGGQVISLVDFNNPDFDTFPKFKDALSSAQVADLEPGDVLYFPALWWHHVEGMDRFNIMINYWWNDVPLHIDDPRAALMHAMLAIRSRPDSEKKGWQEIFNHYVFGPEGNAAEHIPEPARGPLAKLDALSARRLRAIVMRLLNR